MKALIIGCGQIASNYDSPEGHAILTHAHAYQKTSAINDLAFFDLDHSKSQAAAKKWNGRAIDTLEESFDLISVCTNTNQHLETIKQIIPLNPKGILLEKPGGLNLQQCKEIAELAKQKNIPIQVNFNRRFDSSLIELKTKINKREIKPALMKGMYSKGLVNNGSHMINLFNFLFGELIEVRFCGELIDDDSNDPTVSCRLSYENCDVVEMSAFSESNYSIFEYDLLAEQCRYYFSDSGFQLEYQVLATDPLFPGYKELKSEWKKPTGLDKAILNSVENLIYHIEKNEPLLSPIESAITTHKHIDLIQKEKEHHS